MFWFLAILHFFVLSVRIGLTKEEPSFVAAVFEHRSRHDETKLPREIVAANFLYYENAAKIAAEKGADIIVFNEYGLTPHIKPPEKLLKNFMQNIPDPTKGHYNPCLEEREEGDRYILHLLSCLARKNKIYVVANMGDTQPCRSDQQTCDKENLDNCEEKCPKVGAFMYNTDVAFDVEGNLVAKYHKSHPYFELLNTPKEPEYVTFDTSFGKFGIIICFDAVFEEAVILARNYGIDTLIMSTHWFDDILPLNAVELWQAWALANKVNFIAANTHTAGNGSLGSGIYSKHFGALAYTYEPDGESKLVIATVSKNPKDAQEAQIFVVRENGYFGKTEYGTLFPEESYEKMVGQYKDKYSDYRYYKSQTENYTLTKLQDPSGHVQACDNGFCCSLTYSAESMNEDFYLAVKNGSNNVRNYFHWEEEACFLLRCNPFDGKPCVTFPSTSQTVFTSVEMKAQFTTDVIYATVSKTYRRLAPKSEWFYKIKNNNSILKFKNRSKVPLLKVGLLGRCYSRDPPYVPWLKEFY